MSAGAALHRQPVLQVPFHDKSAAPIDVNVPRGMVGRPGDKDVIAPPDLRHDMLPSVVTVFKALASGYS